VNESAEIATAGSPPAATAAAATVNINTSCKTATATASKASSVKSDTNSNSNREVVRIDIDILVTADKNSKNGNEAKSGNEVGLNENVDVSSEERRRHVIDLLESMMQKLNIPLPVMAWSLVNHHGNVYNAVKYFLEVIERNGVVDVDSGSDSDSYDKQLPVEDIEFSTQSPSSANASPSRNPVAVASISESSAAEVKVKALIHTVYNSTGNAARNHEPAITLTTRQSNDVDIDSDIDNQREARESSHSSKMYMDDSEDMDS